MKAPEPLVGGTDTYPRSLRRILGTQAIEHALNQKGSTSRGKTGMLMQVNPGLLEGCVGRASRIPGTSRMNNLLRDHS